MFSQGSSLTVGKNATLYRSTGTEMQKEEAKIYFAGLETAGVDRSHESERACASRLMRQ